MADRRRTNDFDRDRSFVSVKLISFPRGIPSTRKRSRKGMNGDEWGEGEARMKQE